MPLGGGAAGVAGAPGSRGVLGGLAARAGPIGSGGGGAPGGTARRAGRAPSAVRATRRAPCQGVLRRGGRAAGDRAVRPGDRATQRSDPRTPGGVLAPAADSPGRGGRRGSPGAARERRARHPRRAAAARRGGRGRGERHEPRVHGVLPRRPRSRGGFRPCHGRAGSGARGADHVQVPGPPRAAQLRVVPRRSVMGLLTGLLTLPLAPIRGTVWIAEQIAEQAARELDEGRTIRRQLAEAELRYERGELTVEELEAIEDELLERLRLAGELDATDWRR